MSSDKFRRIDISQVVSASTNEKGELRGAATAQAIQEWLTGKFNELLGKRPGDINIDEPLASYGLVSIQAVSLTGDLEDWLELQLPPTLLWDYPSINALAEYLANQVCPT